MTAHLECLLQNLPETMAFLLHRIPYWFPLREVLLKDIALYYYHVATKNDTERVILFRDINIH